MVGWSTRRRGKIDRGQKPEATSSIFPCCAETVYSTFYRDVGTLYPIPSPCDVCAKARRYHRRTIQVASARHNTWPTCTAQLDRIVLIKEPVKRCGLQYIGSHSRNLFYPIWRSCVNENRNIDFHNVGLLRKKYDARNAQFLFIEQSEPQAEEKCKERGSSGCAALRISARDISIATNYSNCTNGSERFVYRRRVFICTRRECERIPKRRCPV